MLLQILQIAILAAGTIGVSVIMALVVALLWEDLTDARRRRRGER